MNKFLLLALIFVLHISSYSQYSPKKSSFSYFSLGLYGGFTTDDFVLFDTSTLLEIKTNLTQQFFLHLSVGHYSIDKPEENNEFNVTPVSFGLSYFILHGHSSPYIIMEAGYNFCQCSQAVKEDDFNLGLGAGLYYNMYEHLKMDFKYIYKYNHGFDNIHHMMVGFVYSF